MVIRNSPSPAERARAARASAEPRYRQRLHRALRTFGVRLPRIRQDLVCLASAHADRLKASVRKLAVTAALGVLAGVVAVAVLATAAVLLVTGIAGGLGTLFGAAWLGQLVAAVVVLGGIAAAGAIVLGRARQKRMRALVERYARFDRSAAGHPAGPDAHGSSGADAPARPEVPRPEAVRR
jgi:hypothetical protein